MEQRGERGKRVRGASPVSDFRQQLHDLCVTHGMTKEQVEEIAQATVDMAAATGDTAEHVAALLLMALRTDGATTAVEVKLCE